MDIVNPSGKEKICIIQTVESTSGSSNAPNRMESVGKFAVTSGQITKVSFVVNVAGKEKLGIMAAVREENDSNSEPSRTECAFKWTTTSGQITSITAHNDQSGNFGVGSYVKVYGAD